VESLLGNVWFFTLHLRAEVAVFYHADYLSYGGMALNRGARFGVGRRGVFFVRRGDDRRGHNPERIEGV
jgi:hypothetical protein